MTTFARDPESVTACWLSEVLHADVREHRLEQIGVGIGLLGRLDRVLLVGGPAVPASVVVKLPTLDTKARSALCEDLEFYLSEVRFYPYWQDSGMDSGAYDLARLAEHGAEPLHIIFE